MFSKRGSAGHLRWWSCWSSLRSSAFLSRYCCLRCRRPVKQLGECSARINSSRSAWHCTTTARREGVSAGHDLRRFPGRGQRLSVDRISRWAEAQTNAGVSINGQRFQGTSWMLRTLTFMEGDTVAGNWNYVYPPDRRHPTPRSRQAIPNAITAQPTSKASIAPPGGATSAPVRTIIAC